jgi:hypothetical protein
MGERYIVAQLRPHLTTRRNSSTGFGSKPQRLRAVGAYRGGRLIGRAGDAPVRTLVRGPHPCGRHRHRGSDESGGGGAPSWHAEADARARGMTAVFLDARPGDGFYPGRSAASAPVPSMKKTL